MTQQTMLNELKAGNQKMQTEINFDIAVGKHLRDQGIKRAEDKANKDVPGWSSDADFLFEDWLKGWPAGFKFMTEDFRKIAQIKGLPDPHSNRAFGGVAVRARNKNLIRSVGLKMVKNRRAHACFATQWEKI